MGLGKAAAKEGTKVFERAAETDLQNNTGDNAARALPSCGNSTPYTVSPIAVSDIQGIDPLGHVNPSGHTFPSDHIYFYIRPVDPLVPYGPRALTNVLAPGDIHVTLISSSYTNGNPATVDYGIQFYACRELKSYFGHVKTLDPALLAKLNSTNQSCMDYTTGGTLFHSCNAGVNFPLSAGDVMGTVGGPGAGAALDFGSYDYRQTPLPFANLPRHYNDQPFTVCPIDYYVPSMKATLEPHFGRYDGGYARTALPLCGEINYDVRGTAMGDWYHIGSPDSPEDPHLSLIKDNVYNPRQDISVGTSVSGVGPIFFPFDPLTSGTHNRDFSQVTADGQVYCYDTFFDPVGQPASPGYSVLITMPTSTTLRVDKYNATSCGPGPWTMDSNYGEFQR